MKQSAKEYKRIVVKIGSSLLSEEGNICNASVLNDIVTQVASLAKSKNEIVLVSSGAIAIGMSVMGSTARPKELASLQALASVGQHFLMSEYRQAFEKEDLVCGQILLTWDDFNDRSRYVNARHTIVRLLQLGIVPVINENDTVSTDEIKFGDNDKLSALVASLVGADLLIILSDVPGLLDREKKVIAVVNAITPEIKSFACPTQKKTCVGGMITKLAAAQIAIDSGIPCVIADGRCKGVITAVIQEPLSCGTIFLPQKELAARQRWIAFGTQPKGLIRVDEGAREALSRHKSLLAVGITGIEGTFDEGDVVSIVDARGKEFARGKVCISYRLLDKIKGTRYHKEIVHCDNIVIL